MKITKRKCWYTGVTDTNRPIVILSGPYATKEDADSMVADPGSRDRRMAEELDLKAHFFTYATVRIRERPKQIVAETVRGRAALEKVEG